MSGCDTCTETTPIPNAPPCPPAAPCPPRLCAPQEWTCGGWLYKEVDGCTTRTRLVGVLPDGIYTNPVITLSNGCISRIENGSAVVQMRPNPCTTTSGGGGGTTPATVTVNPSNCNLTSSGALGLLTNVTFDQVTSNVSVTGCGTATNPFILTAPTNTGGGTGAVTYKCGIAVQTPLSTPVDGITFDSAVSNVVSASYGAAGTCKAKITFSGADYDSCGIKISKGIVETFTGCVVSNTVDSSISTVASFTNTNCVSKLVLSGADYDACGTKIVKGVVQTFGGFVKNIALPSNFTSSFDAATCTLTITPPASVGVSMPFVRCIGDGSGNAFVYGTKNTTYTFSNLNGVVMFNAALPASGALIVNLDILPSTGDLLKVETNGFLLGHLFVYKCVT